MFKRKVYDYLKAWKEESDGMSAVMIEGARRVGKSTVALEFARKEYDESIENQGIHLQRVKADRWLNIGFRETW